MAIFPSTAAKIQAETLRVVKLRPNKKAPCVLISGYYGFGNCGDEAVLLAVIQCLKKLKPDVCITVLSNTPAVTKTLYDVNAVQRWNPISIILATISCDMLISGGGSLLQDVTSSKSLLYYLAVIKCALFLKKKVFIYSQGIGPLSGERNRSRVARVFNRCSDITVRDKRSAELLSQSGVRQAVSVTSDPVMALTREDIDNRAVEQDKPLLIAIIRPWADNQHIAPIADFLDAQVLNGWDVMLVPAYYEQDIDVLIGIGRLMAQQHHILEEKLTAREFIMLISSANCVLSMRLHGLICAMAMEIPMLALSYDPKVEAFMEQAKLGQFCFKYDQFNREVAESIMFDPDALVMFDNYDNSYISDGAPYNVNDSDRLSITSHISMQKNNARRLEMHAQAWNTAKKAVAVLDHLRTS